MLSKTCMLVSFVAVAFVAGIVAAIVVLTASDSDLPSVDPQPERFCEGFNQDDQAIRDIVVAKIEQLAADVILIDADIPCLPENVFGNLTDEQLFFGSITFLRNGMKKISPDAFQTKGNFDLGFSGISLEQNLLETLPTGIFRNMPDLKEIDLGFNRIAELPTDFFSKDFPATEVFMSLDLNPMLKGIPEAFRGSGEHFIALSFTDCHSLDDLPEDIFNDYNLDSINVRNTLIEAKFTKEEFISKSSLKENVGIVGYEFVDEGPCLGLEEDQTIREAVANQVANAGAGATVLDFGSSTFTCLVPNLFGSVANLEEIFERVEELRFTSGLLTEVTQNAFHGIPLDAAAKLKKISFANNKDLKEISFGALIPFQKLVDVDFSGLGVSSTSKLPLVPTVLEKLDMSRNDFRLLETPFPLLDVADFIDLSSNPSLADSRINKDKLKFIRIKKLDLSATVFNGQDPEDVADLLGLDLDVTELVLGN